MEFNTSDEIIFFRDPKEYKINRYSTKADTTWPKLVIDTYNMFYPLLDSYSSWSCYDEKGKVYDGYNGIQRRIIMFAGKIYPVVLISLVNKSGEGTQDYWLYSFDDVIKFMDTNNLSFTRPTNRHIFVSKNSEKNLRSFFTADYPKECYTFLLENKISICVLGNNSIRFNVNLSTYDFYKKLGTYTAYQELDMWISGTLSYPQNIMIEVEDKSKITKHGFCNKYSFRKRPKV
mgnify:CR=1 FL=1